MRRVRMNRQRALALVLSWIACFGVATLPAAAEGFRIENQVFGEKDEELITRSTTIFYEDLIYDYLENPREITVFDPAAGRIVLLAPLKKVQTELSTRDLELLSRRLRQWASNQANEFLRFCAEPEFEEEFDSSAGELRLSSTWLSYRVSGQEAARREILEQYLEFCDWYALLNARLNPGSRPPYPRLLVNEALGRHELMPTEVHLTVRPKGERFLGEEVRLKSEHHVVPHLLESDRSRVAQTDEFMAIFRRLPFREYQTHVQPSR